MSQEVELWIQRHTFTCKVGRVSPAQCQQNREKPTWTEQLLARRKVAARSTSTKTARGKPLPSQEAGDKPKKPLGGFRPGACAHCRDYERLCNELAAQNETKQEEVTMNSADSPELGAPKQPAICVCDCGKQFEAYKRGAVTVKKICPECLDKKAAHPRSASKDEPKQPEGREPSCGAGITRKPTRKAASDHQLDTAPAEITIAFHGPDEEMFRRIEALATRKRRTVPAQVLVWLETLVPELQADIAEK
jgi:hypothetical protein